MAVADAVAAAGEPQAVLGGDALEVAMVVHVAEVGLEGVVVDVGHGKLCADPWNADGLELQVGHGAGGVLGEGLVDADGNVRSPLDGLSGDKLSVRAGLLYDVSLQNLFCQGQCHCILLCS